MPDRTHPSWRRDKDPAGETTQGLNLDEIRALLEETRSAAIDARALAETAAAKRPAPKASPVRRQAVGAAWARAAVLIVLIVVVGSVAIGGLYLVAVYGLLR